MKVAADQTNNYTVSDVTAMLVNALKLLNKANDLYTETIEYAYYFSTEEWEEDKKRVPAAFAAVRDCIFTGIRDSIQCHLPVYNDEAQEGQEQTKNEI